MNTMNPILKLHSLGQSIWYDNIQRRLLENGEMAAMISNGDIRGVTSNPSIFQSAIAKSHDYDQAILPMAWSGWESKDIFYQLAYEDIRAATDLFRKLYEDTSGADGYVSLEVSPYLAHDTQGTIDEARRLWIEVNRPNLMIKIPATKEGIPAIRQVIASGINVNVTLIFSLTRYALVMDVYLQGLEDRVNKNLPIDRIASVASFFVSRVDTKVDAQLHEKIVKEDQYAETAASLLGKIAIANAKLAYEQFCSTFGSARFARLRETGAHPQRPLWASTSTKNPTYVDVMYIDGLIGPDTVNTVPPHTLDAFRDHGASELTLASDIEAAHEQVNKLDKLGIDMAQITQELEDEGVKAFADAFTVLLKTIDERSNSARAMLGSLHTVVKNRVLHLESEKTIERLFDHDPTLWTTDPVGQKEIKKRLGWLNLPDQSRSLLPSIINLADECKKAGYTHVLLLGMGGSSLAPEVLQLLAKNFQAAWSKVGLDLAILDSTDPRQVHAAAIRSSINQTIYIVSSKSGTTAETTAYLDYFWERTVRKLGKRAGEHFVAITDPGTPLESLAKERRFSQVFLAEPEVGGRYSALSAFGLVPAGLIGYDVDRLLTSSQAMAAECRPDLPVGRNPGAVLGAIMGEAFLAGRDKLTFIADDDVAAFGSWLEQLIAESSGKDGKGIIPIDGEAVGVPSDYRDDRIFVYLRSEGQFDQQVDKLRNAKQPVITLSLHNEYDLGKEFYHWEIGIAIACAIIGVNGFDQPDVKDSKTRTVQKVAQFKQTGHFDEGLPAWKANEASIFCNSSLEIADTDSISAVFGKFLKSGKPGDYVALNAYLPNNPNNGAQLSRLRTKIRKMTGLATTVGFGPRFLHSTGQLHKGGLNNGLFIQFTSDADKDLKIPEEGITFGALERAQSLADMDALAARKRRVLRIHLQGVRLDTIL